MVRVILVDVMKDRYPTQCRIGHRFAPSAGMERGAIARLAELHTCRGPQSRAVAGVPAIPMVTITPVCGLRAFPSAISSLSGVRLAVDAGPCDNVGAAIARLTFRHPDHPVGRT